MSRPPALIVVDVQNDFCEGGSLAVSGGAQLATDLAHHLAQHTGNYSHVVATRDYHIDPGAHFSDEPDFVRSWPPHCRAGTAGADFHPNLNTSQIEAVFDKGQYSDGYSGFEGQTTGEVLLAQWLHDNGVSSVEVVGIATDHCVRATALDAARNGLATRVRLDLTAGVATPTVTAAMKQLRAAEIELLGQPRVAN